MRNLKLADGETVFDALHPGGMLMVPNRTCERDDGSEGTTGLDKEHPLKIADEMGANRFQGLVSDRNFIAVAPHAEETSRELARYHRERKVNTLTDRGIIPVGSGEDWVVEAVEDNPKAVRQHMLENGNYPEWMVGFIISQFSEKVSAQLGLKQRATYAAAEKVNNKGYALAQLAERGVNVPRGVTVHTEDGVRAAYRDIREQTGATTIFAKLSRASVGKGVFALQSERDLDAFLQEPGTKTQLAEGLGVRIDQGINATRFPNCFVHVGETAADDRWLASSYQILTTKGDEVIPTVYKGNMGPVETRYEEAMKRMASQVTEWMREQGFQGEAGFDFILEDLPDGSFKLYFLEINGRINGNTPTSAKALEMGAPYWGTDGGVPVPQGTTLNEFAGHLDRNHIHLRRDGGNPDGAFIITDGLAPNGKMLVGAVGDSPGRVAEILELSKMESPQDIPQAAE